MGKQSLSRDYNGTRGKARVRQRALRVADSIAAVVAVTWAGYSVLHVNAATVGFAYLLLVFIIASTLGLVAALVASCIATVAFNFFFLPPIGTMTIADPQNWIALFSFLAATLIASRLSARAESRTLEAVARQRDVERLYTFSRSILLMDSSQPFPKQLATKVAEIFELNAAVLYDRRADTIYRAGPSDFEGMDDQLREAARQGTSFSNGDGTRVISAVRLGAEPIGSLALQGAGMQDSVLQGIGNLVAIGLEWARSQEMAHQIEIAQESDRLRTAVIDALAHEFKTPLTAIKAATSSLLSNANQPQEQREVLLVADEEAERLRELIDDSIEMARLDTAHIDLRREPTDIGGIVNEVVAGMRPDITGRSFSITLQPDLPQVPLDRRLVKLALRQIVDNALKYSPADQPVELRLGTRDGSPSIDVTDHGPGIPATERSRIFERFYRSPSAKRQMPGSGLGLSIAQSIMRAHNGDLTVTSRPGETTFSLTFPVSRGAEAL